MRDSRLTGCHASLARDGGQGRAGRSSWNPVDLDAAAAALMAISVAGAEYPEYSELEVNPMLAHPGGTVALDAHGVLASANEPERYGRTRQLALDRRIAAASI